MVTNNPSVQSSQNAPGIIDQHPESMKDLRESRHDRFVIKFYGNFCPPCKSLEAWLHNTYKPKAPVPVYHVNVERASGGNFEETVTGKFSVMSLPTLVVTDKSLQQLDKLVGFNEEKVAALLDRHFSRGQ